MTSSAEGEVLLLSEQLPPGVTLPGAPPSFQDLLLLILRCLCKQNLPQAAVYPPPGPCRHTLISFIRKLSAPPVLGSFSLLFPAKPGFISLGTLDI